MLSLPYRQVVVSALDAVAHAIESFFSIGATNGTRKTAKEALLKCLPSLASIRPNQIETSDLANFQAGAFLAGQAINVTKTNLPHALSYYLTSKFGFEHGLAVSFSIEKYLIYISDRKQHLNLEHTQSLEFIQKLTSPLTSAHWTNWNAVLADLGFAEEINSLKKQTNPNVILENANEQRLRNFSLFTEFSEIRKYFGECY